MQSTSSKIQSSLITFLRELPDPRVQGRCKHRLIDVVVISVCALLCGAESWVEIAEFGRSRMDWFKRYLSLDHGIPSHDTFARVFSLLRVDVFEKLFWEWSSSVSEALLRRADPKNVEQRRQEHLCVDGKSLCGTAGPRRGNSALHLVSLYSHDSGVVLGQLKANAAGSESHTVLECLEQLDIEGALISADAASATKNVTRLIRLKKADYLIPLKSGARKSLLRTLFPENQPAPRPLAAARQEEESHHHGRIEKRECRVFSAARMPDRFNKTWADVQSIIEITRTRSRADYSCRAQAPGAFKTTIETVYYISSKKGIKAQEAISLTRAHWSIENQLHWQLDVSFREDDWKVRDQKAARSLALVRKMAFNLVKANSETGSVRVKMKRAAWNPSFLEKVVFHSKI